MCVKAGRRLKFNKVPKDFNPDNGKFLCRCCEDESSIIKAISFSQIQGSYQRRDLRICQTVKGTIPVSMA
jgi:hypothetical protein